MLHALEHVINASHEVFNELQMVGGNRNLDAFWAACSGQIQIAGDAGCDRHDARTADGSACYLESGEKGKRAVSGVKHDVRVAHLECSATCMHTGDCYPQINLDCSVMYSK